MKTTMMIVIIISYLSGIASVLGYEQYQQYRDVELNRQALHTFFDVKEPKN